MIKVVTDPPTSPPTAASSFYGLVARCTLYVVILVVTWDEVVHSWHRFQRRTAYFRDQVERKNARRLHTEQIRYLAQRARR